MSVLGLLSELANLAEGPVLFVGDWQAEPAEYASWAEAMGLQFVLPAGSPATCSSGLERLLDFGFDNRAGYELIERAYADFHVPWSPHAAVVFVLESEPEKRTVSGLDGPQDCPPCVGVPQLIAWDRAAGIAKETRSRLCHKSHLFVRMERGLQAGCSTSLSRREGWRSPWRISRPRSKYVMRSLRVSLGRPLGSS